MQYPLTLRVGQRTAQTEAQGQFAVHRTQLRRQRTQVGQEEQVLHLHVSFKPTLRQQYSRDTDFLPTTA